RAAAAIEERVSELAETVRIEAGKPITLARSPSRSIHPRLPQDRRRVPRDRGRRGARQRDVVLSDRQLSLRRRQRLGLRAGRRALRDGVDDRAARCGDRARVTALHAALSRWYPVETGVSCLGGVRYLRLFVVQSASPSARIGRG